MKRDWHSEEFKVLVTLGESTTAGGWSSSRERCWASRLAALISDVQAAPVKLVNSGIGANVISTRSPCYEHSGKPAATERLDKHVIPHHPDLLIISYGLNDARGGTPLELFAEEEVLARNCSGLAKHTKAMEHDIPPWRDESTLAVDYGHTLSQPNPR